MVCVYRTLYSFKIYDKKYEFTNLHLSMQLICILKNLHINEIWRLLKMYVNFLKLTNKKKLIFIKL